MNKFSLMDNGLDNLFVDYNMEHNYEMYSLFIYNVIDMLQFLYTKVRYAIGFNKEDFYLSQWYYGYTTHDVHKHLLVIWAKY